MRKRIRNEILALTVMDEIKKLLTFPLIVMIVAILVTYFL